MNINKAHKDIINAVPKVLLVGYGWVGQFLGKYFKDAHYIDEENILRRVKDNTEVKQGDEDFLEKYDFAFISVPTPMHPSGECDISIIEEVVKKWKEKVGYFCIKSTVEIGTTNNLIKKYGIKACMSPEYLGETVGHPLVEAQKNTFVVLGGAPEVTQKFAELWSLVTNSYTRIYQVSSETAELCKLMENSFIATKVMFVNEFFDLAEAIGVDFNQLREVWLADPRVSRSHTYVYRNNRGFSGKCLPKDLNNLTYYFREKNKKVRARLIEFLLEYNADLRKNYKDSIRLLPSKE